MHRCDLHRAPGCGRGRRDGAGTRQADLRQRRGDVVGGSRTGRCAGSDSGLAGCWPGERARRALPHLPARDRNPRLLDAIVATHEQHLCQVGHLARVIRRDDEPLAGDELVPRPNLHPAALFPQAVERGAGAITDPAPVTRNLERGAGEGLQTGVHDPASPHRCRHHRRDDAERGPLGRSRSELDLLAVAEDINPGNSGGPLLNLKGEVIGINSAIYSNTGVNAGIGFAVPSNTVKKVVQSIISSGKYLHPYLGVVGMDITPQLAKIFGLNESTGFFITDITPGSPAAKSGKLQKGTITYNQRGEIIDADGDIIVAIDDKEVRKIDDILTYLEREKEVGDTVTLKILRNDKLEDVKILLDPRITEEEPSLLQQYDKEPVPKQDDFLAQCYQFLPKSLCDLLR